MDFGDDDDDIRSNARSSVASRTRTQKMNRGSGGGGGGGGADDNFLDIQNEPHIVDPDEEFEGECCFWLMKLLRGFNVGRRLKRKVFKYALLNFIVGFSMLVITVYEEQSWGLMKMFANTVGGLSLIQVQYFVSFLALIIFFTLLFGLYHWASLVTNKDLLQKLVFIVLAYGAMQFIMTIYWTVTFFISFRGVDFENDPTIPRAMLACYIMTIIFMLPYLLSMFLYLMDISYLSGEIDLRGDISEPEVPEGTTDLSNVTLRDICGACLAAPCLICLQLFALCDCFRCICSLCKKDERQKRHRRRKRGAVDEEDGWGTRISAMFGNVINMIRQPGKRDHKTVPNRDMDLEAGPEPSSREIALKNLRERRAGAIERSVSQLTDKTAEPEEKASDVKISGSPSGTPGGKELRALQQSQTPTLSVHQFKALWSSLQVLGSFQCKLRSAPNMQALTQHLRKQNFHVVFAASPSDTETEVSLCNIRPSGEDTWFMARFLFSKSVFSAAMKAQNADEVEGYVKKFALARVLKIDTSTVS